MKAIKRLTIVLFILLLECMSSYRVAGQEAIFVPNCSGLDDTSEFVMIISAIGANNGTIRLPYKNGSRCAVNDLTIPANIALDNTDGTGIRINTGQTLTILGPVTDPPAKQFFYNALAGQGATSFASNKTGPIFHPDWWGVSPGTDCQPALQALIDAVPPDGAHIVFLAGITYSVSHTTFLKANLTIDGYGATIDAAGIGNDLFRDTFLIRGSNTAGLEGANVTIRGFTMINNTQQYAIDVYGQPFTYPPHDVRIKDITTRGSLLTGALYINVGHHVWYENCVNVGGVEHIGVEAPLVALGGTGTSRTHHVWIKNCSTTGTTQYGYHLVYGSDIWIENSSADGTLMTSGDQSGIVVDRSQRVRVINNTSTNSPKFNILISGSWDVLTQGNIVWGPGSGIAAGYNFETALDPNADESHRIVLTDNIIKNFGTNQNGLIIIGVIDVTAKGNIIGSGGSLDIGVLVADQERPTDGKLMKTQNLTFDGNVVFGTAQFSAGHPANVGVNQVGAYTGSSYALKVANGAQGGVDFSNGSSMYRDAGTGRLKILGASLEARGGLRLQNAYDTARLGKYAATLTPASIGANSSAEQIFVVPGVRAGDVIVCNKPTFQSGLTIGGYRVASDDHVAIVFSNSTSSTITPVSETYVCQILQ